MIKFLNEYGQNSSVHMSTTYEVFTTGNKKRICSAEIRVIDSSYEAHKLPLFKPSGLLYVCFKTLLNNKIIESEYCRLRSTFYIQT